jgi:hypothetical protein
MQDVNLFIHFIKSENLTKGLFLSPNRFEGRTPSATSRSSGGTSPSPNSKEKIKKLENKYLKLVKRLTDIQNPQYLADLTL